MQHWTQSHLCPCFACATWVVCQLPTQVVISVECKLCLSNNCLIVFLQMHFLRAFVGEMGCVFDRQQKIMKFSGCSSPRPTVFKFAKMLTTICMNLLTWCFCHKPRSAEILAGDPRKGLVAHLTLAPPKFPSKLHFSDLLAEWPNVNTPANFSQIALIVSFLTLFQRLESFSCLQTGSIFCSISSSHDSQQDFKKNQLSSNRAVWRSSSMAHSVAMLWHSQVSGPLEPPQWIHSKD